MERKICRERPGNKSKDRKRKKYFMLKCVFTPIGFSKSPRRRKMR